MISLNFKRLLSILALASVPNAVAVENNIPIYDVMKFRDALTNASTKSELMAEWAWVLKESSGAIVLRNAYQDTAVIDATKLYENIIKQEKPQRRWWR